MKLEKKTKIIYFSLICNTPTKAKRLNANTGAQTAKINGILSVCPKARDKSLK